MQVTRTFNLLDRYREEFPDKEDALAGKVNGQWAKYSSRQYIDIADHVSYGLLALGVKKGDKVASISNNRPEWNFLDMGIAQTGAVHVPLFTSLDAQTYKGLLSHAGASYVFVSDADLAAKIVPLVTEVSSLKGMYTFDEVAGVPGWKTITELGEQNAERLREQLEDVKRSIHEDDCVTLIYTSGTTGESKGVLLSHQNLLFDAKGVAGVFQLKPQHRYVSILPLCHVGERMANYQTQYSGCGIYYAESVSTIARDLQDVKPHGFGAVPRLLEKVYQRIVAKGESLSGLKRTLFFWALNLAQRYEPGGSNGILYDLQLRAARFLIFRKWRQALGGNVKFIGVGGAALSEKLERIFWAAGIKLLNMYGLTESSPVITINRSAPPLLRLGTVGAALGQVQVRIAEDGEILCKGPNVMLGYYKDPGATADAIDKAGWLHTGDVGELVEGTFLKITDRKKEIFKLSNGKYVTPQAIEILLNESPFIDQSMVVGEGQKFASALISPNTEMLKKWCQDKGIIVQSVSEMISHPEVVKHYRDCVEAVNSSLDPHQKLKRTRLVSDAWTPESGLLSPTLKLRRRVITERYQSLILEIFG
jgi:long-chain acyl-CoA synthetase